MTTIIERIGHREKNYILKVLDQQFRTSAGSDMTGRLEKEFAKLMGVDFAIAFNNGTATMHAVLAATGIEEGDEVIVPPLTMASTSFAVFQARALPVFADINPRTFTIDPESIKNNITPRTKAIIPVSIYGLSPDMDSIMEIARENNLLVLADDAQSLLSFYHGKIVGSIAHASSFSFQSSKHITSGEGGMVVTNDHHLAEKIRRFNSLGYRTVKAGQGKITDAIIQDPNYLRHDSIGWNYRMPELCAAVVLGQLEHVDEIVSMRKKTAQLYSQMVQNCEWMIPQAVGPGQVHSYWSFVLRLSVHAPVSWKVFYQTYLDFGGDGIYAAWQLTYLEPALLNKKFISSQTQDFSPGLCPVAEKVQPQLLQFKTNYFDLSIAEQKAEALAKTIQHFGG